MKDNPIRDKFSLMNPFMWPNRIEEDSLQTGLSDAHQMRLMLLPLNLQEVSQREKREHGDPFLDFVVWTVSTNQTRR